MLMTVQHNEVKKHKQTKQLLINQINKANTLDELKDVLVLLLEHTTLKNIK